MPRTYDVADEGSRLGTYAKLALAEVVEGVALHPNPRSPTGFVGHASGVHIEVKDRRRLRASLVTMARRRGMKVATKWARCTDHGNYHKCGLLWVVEAR